jgi:hypothetical protein
LRQELLSSTGVARVLGVAEQTVRLWKSQGSGPPSQLVAGQHIYCRDEVLAWAASQPRRRRPALHHEESDGQTAQSGPG